MEEMHQIKLLAAIGLSKTRSEELKKGMKQLQYGRAKKANEGRGRASMTVFYLDTSAIISQEGFEMIISTFSQELEPFLIRSIDDKIVADALDKVVKHALKSADAIQLSTVAELREMMEEVGENIVFICDDEELIRAGKRENLEVINPREGRDKLKLKQMLR